MSKRLESLVGNGPPITYYMQFRDNPTEIIQRDPGNTVLQTSILEDSPSPKSTARLAAEAAFSRAPVQPPTAQQPLIVIRRKRFAVAGAPDSSQSGDGRTLDERRGPRVFRAVAPVGLGLPEAQVSAPPAQAGRSEALEDLESTPRESARKERLARKKPSKVVRIVFRGAAEQGPGQESQAEVMDASDDKVDCAAPDRWNRLATSMENLKLSLAELKRLEAFSLESSRYASDWLKLERRTAAIRQELRACLLATVASGPCLSVRRGRGRSGRSP